MSSSVNISFNSVLILPDVSLQTSSPSITKVDIVESLSSCPVWLQECVCDLFYCNHTPIARFELAFPVLTTVMLRLSASYDKNKWTSLLKVLLWTLFCRFRSDFKDSNITSFSSLWNNNKYSDNKQYKTINTQILSFIGRHGLVLCGAPVL